MASRVIWTLMFLTAISAQRSPPVGSFSKALLPTAEKECQEINWKLLYQSVAHLASSLPPTNLYITFQGEIDKCLIELLWSRLIAVRVLTTSRLLDSLENFSYKQPLQVILFGDIEWLSSVMSMVSVYYSTAKVNARKTRWLWVEASISSNEKETLNTVNPSDLTSDIMASSPMSFQGSMETVSRSLSEGMRGLLVSYGRQSRQISSLPIASQGVQRWVNIGSINSPGDGSWKLKFSGTWTAQGGLTILRPLWPEVSFDLQGRTIRIGCLKKPTVFFYEIDNAHLKDTNGYAADIVKLIQKKLNFTDVLVPNTGFGAFRNGSWNGMVGDLYRGKSDVSPTDFTPIWQRTLVIDFGLIYSNDPVVIISKAPKVFIKPLLLLEIFTPFVWCCLAAIGLVSGVFLATLMKIKQLLGHGHSGKRGFTRYTAAALKIVVTQPSNQTWPSWMGGRIIGGCMMFLAVVVASLYKGSITAYLAIPFRSEPINSLEEMLERNVVPAIRLLSSPYSFFLTENSGILGEKVREIMVTFSGSQVSGWNFLKKVAEGKYAWIDTASSAIGRSSRYEELGKQCLYHVGSNNVRIDLDAFGFPKNSIVKQQFDEIMRWLRNYGIIEEMKRSSYSQGCISVASSDGPQIISITQVQGAFYVLFIGFMMSAIFFLVEGTIFYCKRKNY